MVCLCEYRNDNFGVDAIWNAFRMFAFEILLPIFVIFFFLFFFCALFAWLNFRNVCVTCLPRCLSAVIRQFPSLLLFSSYYISFACVRVRQKRVVHISWVYVPYMYCRVGVLPSRAMHTVTLYFMCYNLYGEYVADLRLGQARGHVTMAQWPWP